MSLPTAHDIFDNPASLQDLDIETLGKLHITFQKELAILNKEYKQGDPDDYPSDWYDRYIYPVQVAIDYIEDVLWPDSEDDDSDSEDY